MQVYGLHDGHACGYYRVTLPLDMMAANGHDIATSCGWDDLANEYPILVGQRISRVEALGTWRRLRAGHKLVYETDDDLWSIDRTNFAAHLAHNASTVDAVEQAIAISHMVTVSTEPLAEILRGLHDNVHVLPNHIDGRLLEIERPRRDHVVVGWAGGDSHFKDLNMVAEQLRRFFARNPTVEFHNIGTDFTRVLRLPGRVTNWVPDPFDYYRTIDFDIGLAPLTRMRFNNSKSHIKALEYAALGIPVIASDEPPYRDFVLDGVTGFLVRDEHEWSRRLWALVNDTAMRDEMGAKAKQVAAEWTIQSGFRLWEDAYRTLL